MKPYLTRTLFAAMILISAAGQAQATLQTWKLDAVVYQENAGFSPPAFASLGQSISIEYRVDTSAQFPSDISTNAVTSFTMDGITSSAQGYILSIYGFNALNVQPNDARADGVDFLSWNNSNGISGSSVPAYLEAFSAATASPYTSQIRIDFDTNGSVWAVPLSFTLVPEPGTYALLFSGLCCLGFVLRNRKTRRVK